jgi:cell division protein FtsI/penicillin-binding protein 2
MNQPLNSSQSIAWRTKFWYVTLVLIGILFAVRLFYIQVIQHNHYRAEALQGQFKEYEIPAERGVIEAYDGGERVPIVLNEPKYTLFADPKYIENIDEAAITVAGVVNGDSEEFKTLMSQDTRYAILAKKLNEEQSNSIRELEIKGVGTREESYRTYPQGNLAAQVLGFVNDEGEGKYGLEQFANDQLTGKPGQLKAITDASGVPLVSNKDNVITEPTPGQRMVLTIDISMQMQLEAILKKRVKSAKSQSGSALIMEAKTGAIKAMANYPTYHPGKFYEEKDPSVFTNNSVSSPLEVGSVMKPLTTAAAIDSGSVTKNSSYFDPGYFIVDEAKIENVAEVAGSGNREVKDILQRSLNTGATWLLMQMGGGEINAQARKTWHDYLKNRYLFGQNTGIEQGYEAGGVVPDPNEGYGLNIKYANMSFGQGMTQTPVQLAGALAAVVNGGTYYQPRLIDRYVQEDGGETVKEPVVRKEGVVKPQTSKDVRELMESVVERNYLFYGFDSLREGYRIGGKSGTAEFARPDGGYYEDRFNGTFTGFVGGDEVQYIIIARVDDPRIPGYAGSVAAAPIFSDLTTMLLDNFNVLPESR